MARPSEEAIETFTTITGASPAVALQKLEESGGDLNRAVNAYFNEGDSRVNSQPSSRPTAADDLMDLDEPIDVETHAPRYPLYPEATRSNPFSLLDPYFGSEPSRPTSHVPRVTHPREVREIPIDFKDGRSQPSHSRPTIEEITDISTEHVSGIQGAVVIPDDDEDSPMPSSTQIPRLNDDIHYVPPAPSAPGISNISDIEEEMIRAAIEASKKEAHKHQDDAFDTSNDVLAGNSSVEPKPPLGDDELAHAMSLSLKTAEQERALQQGLKVDHKGPSTSNVINLDEQGGMLTANGRRQEVGSHQTESSTKSRSDEEDDEDVVEQPLVRQRSRRLALRAPSSAVHPVNSPPSSPGSNDNLPGGNGGILDEWGGISSEEHDEAVMLEAAMFGGLPERTSYPFRYPSQSSTDRVANLYPRMPRPPSPTLAAQRLLREQQDDEYIAALNADREKEIKAMHEAELRRSEEAAARQAAFEKERLEKEEAERRLIKEQEYERLLTAKESSLPEEPGLNDENAVTVLIRMPDGSRCGRRFLKSDKLQCLINYIDVGRMVKPGSYRLVRPFPRRAFGESENDLSLSELGLTSKQEALFLESI